MRKKEDIVRAFVQTDPTPREVSVSSESAQALQEKMERYQREKLALEVQLDIRELLKRLTSNAPV